MNSSKTHNYTRSVLIQMALVFLVVALAAVWQWNLLHQIYFADQVNPIGWIVNGGILVLFAGGLVELIKRFFEYRSQEEDINEFMLNVSEGRDALHNVRKGSMIAVRYQMLRNLNNRRARINQSALAATLLASESSRNSFLKFVHNVLILTGVFGTIISLSMSLLGASDMLQSGSVLGFADEQTAPTDGLGVMIFGMSTALSTTLTAILAYLFFGYFYIKLTDTQTFLISRVEEVSATILMPHLEHDQDTVARDFSESIRLASELIQKLDQSQKTYAESAKAFNTAIQQMSLKIGELSAASEGSQELIETVKQAAAAQSESSGQALAGIGEVIDLLQQGFRIGNFKIDT